MIHTYVCMWVSVSVCVWVCVCVHCLIKSGCNTGYIRLESNRQNVKLMVISHLNICCTCSRSRNLLHVSYLLTLSFSTIEDFSFKCSTTENIIRKSALRKPQSFCVQFNRCERNQLFWLLYTKNEIRFRENSNVHKLPQMFLHMDYVSDLSFIFVNIFSNS